MLQGYCVDCPDCRDLRKVPEDFFDSFAALSSLKSRTPEPPLTPCPRHAEIPSVESSPSNDSTAWSYDETESATSASASYVQEIIATAGKIETSAADALHMIDELARYRARDSRLGLERDLQKENVETLYLLDTLQNGHLHASHSESKRGRAANFECSELLKDINGLIVARIHAHQSGVIRDTQADIDHALGAMKRLEKQHVFLQEKRMDFKMDIIDCAQPTISQPERHILRREAMNKFKKAMRTRNEVSSVAATLFEGQNFDDSAQAKLIRNPTLHTHEIDATVISTEPECAARLDSLATDVDLMGEELRSAIQTEQPMSTAKSSKLEHFFGVSAATVAQASASTQHVSIHNSTQQHASSQPRTLHTTKRFELENYKLSSGKKDILQRAKPDNLARTREAAPQVVAMSSTDVDPSGLSSELEYRSFSHYGKSEYNHLPRLQYATSNSRIAEHRARAIRGRQQLEVLTPTTLSAVPSVHTDDNSEHRQSAFIAPLSFAHAAAARHDVYNANLGAYPIAPPPGIPHPYFNPHHVGFDSQGELEHAVFGAEFDFFNENTQAYAQARTMPQFDHLETPTRPRYMSRPDQLNARAPSPVKPRDSFMGNLTETSKSMLQQTIAQQAQQQRLLQAQLEQQLRQHQAQMQQMQLNLQDQMQRAQAQMHAQMRAMATQSQSYAAAHYRARSAEQEAQIAMLTSDIASLQAAEAQARAVAAKATVSDRFQSLTSSYRPDQVDTPETQTSAIEKPAYPNVRLQPAPAGSFRGRSVSPQRTTARAYCSSTHTSPTRRPTVASGPYLPRSAFEGVDNYNCNRLAAGLSPFLVGTNAPVTPSWTRSGNWADELYGIDYLTDDETSTDGEREHTPNE